MKLRDYQEELVNKAVQTFGSHGFVYLALETRTGKTPVSIMAAVEIYRKTGAPEILFVTKKAIISSIADTYKKLCDDYPIADVPFRVMSFDSLHKVTQLNGRIIIADEAHSFGSYPKPSRRALMLYGLARGCPVIMLSATPTPESYSSIFWQLAAAHVDCELISPYKNFYQWAHEYVNIKKKRIGTGVYVNDYSDAKKDFILPQFEPFLITLTQEEAGFQQTEIMETIVTVPMPEQIKTMVKRIKTDGVAYHDDIMIVAETAVARMSKTHQLCSGTVIPQVSKTRNETGMGVIISRHKLAQLETITMLYQKVAIFYKYVAELKMLEEAYGDRLTDDYQVFESETDRIFVGQFISKREGIDLKSADVIVCLNIDFAWLSYAQMINRMMSYTRTKKPKLIWLFTQGGIEERILKAVKRKKNFTSSYYKRWKGVE